METIEIAVKISDDEKSLTQKFLHQGEPFLLSRDDGVLSAYVEEAKANFKGSPQEIVVRTVYQWE